MVQTKPFWQSTTLWINVAGIVALILSMVVNTGIIADPQWIALIVAVLNILNRFRDVPKENLTLK
jgi:hypothetical protein